MSLWLLSKKVSVKFVISISNLHDLLDYSSDQIEYTCLKLSEAGYLDITTVQMTQKTTPGIYSVNELTFQGHEFLSNISSQKVLIN